MRHHDQLRVLHIGQPADPRENAAVLRDRQRATRLLAAQRGALRQTHAVANQDASAARVTRLEALQHVAGHADDARDGAPRDDLVQGGVEGAFPAAKPAVGLGEPMFRLHDRKASRPQGARREDRRLVTVQVEDVRAVAGKPPDPGRVRTDGGRGEMLHRGAGLLEGVVETAPIEKTDAQPDARRRQPPDEGEDLRFGASPRISAGQHGNGQRASDGGGWGEMAVGWHDVHLVPDARGFRQSLISRPLHDTVARADPARHGASFHG
jgi:hypothetical protein